MEKIDYSIDNRIDLYSKRRNEEYEMSCTFLNHGNINNAMNHLILSISYLRLELRYKIIKIRRNHCAID